MPMKKNTAISKFHTILTIKVLFLSAFLICLMVISLLILYVQSKDTKEQVTALIYKDGDLVRTIHLWEVTETESFILEGNDGSYNEITIAPGKIAVTDADCPDRLCVSFGYGGGAKLPIICLPHHLAITFETDDTQAPDAVTY